MRQYRLITAADRNFLGSDVIRGYAVNAKADWRGTFKRSGNSGRAESMRSAHATAFDY